MDFLKPLLWQQGNFLEPQHLQYLDLYHKNVAVYLFKKTFAYNWGVYDIRFDEDELRQGILKIISLDVIFKSGEWLKYPDNAILKAKSFSSAWVDGQDKLDVYIAVKKISQKSNQYGQGSTHESFLASKNRSFIPKVIESYDIYSEENSDSVELKVVSQYIEILWAAELEQFSGYEFLKIASLVKDYEGNVRLDDAYIPPMLNLFGFNILADMFSEIESKIKEKKAFFDSDEIDKSKALLSEDINWYRLFYIQLRQLFSRYIVIINQYTYIKNVEPILVYYSLYQFFEELNVFLRKKHYVNIFDYDHENIFNSFSSVISGVEQLLNKVHADYDEIQKNILKAKKETVYKIKLQKLAKDKDAKQAKVTDVKRKEAIYFSKLGSLNKFKRNYQKVIEKTQLEVGIEMQLKALNKIKLEQHKDKLLLLAEEKRRALLSSKLEEKLKKDLESLNYSKLEKQKIAEDAEKIELRDAIELQGKLRVSLSKLNNAKLEEYNLLLKREFVASFVSIGEAKFSCSMFANEIVSNQGGVYLIISNGSPVDEWRDNFVSLFKLGSSSEVDAYIQYSVQGIDLKYITHTPKGMQNIVLNNKLDACFELELDSEAWKKAYKEDKLVLYFPNVGSYSSIKLAITKI